MKLPAAAQLPLDKAGITPNHLVGDVWRRTGSVSFVSTVGGGWLDWRVPVLGFLTPLPRRNGWRTLGRGCSSPLLLQQGVLRLASWPWGHSDLTFSDPLRMASLLMKCSAKRCRALVTQFRLDFCAVCLKGNELS